MRIDQIRWICICINIVWSSENEPSGPASAEKPIQYSTNRKNNNNLPCNAFKYAFPALISCRAPGLNFSKMFC